MRLLQPFIPVLNAMSAVWLREIWKNGEEHGGKSGYLGSSPFSTLDTVYNLFNQVITEARTGCLYWFKLVNKMFYWLSLATVTCAKLKQDTMPFSQYLYNVPEEKGVKCDRLHMIISFGQTKFKNYLSRIGFSLVGKCNKLRARSIQPKFPGQS